MQGSEKLVHVIRPSAVLDKMHSDAGPPYDRPKAGRRVTRLRTFEAARQIRLNLASIALTRGFPRTTWSHSDVVYDRQIFLLGRRLVRF